MKTLSIRTICALPLAAIALIAFPPLSKAATETKTQPAPTPAATAPATAAAPVAKPAVTPAAPAAPTPKAPAPTAAPTPPPAAVTAPSASDAKDEKDFYNKAPIRLEEVEISETRPTALNQAPADSNLDTYQPQSIIDLSFITNHLAPTADYSTIANLAPSVANVVTNGPGLSDAKRATLRGFVDTQYNVTYDGIPFADTNDFSHHTTSYFPAKMIGRVTVDRGPGTASSIGEATFGGTIALLSKDPRTDAAVIPTMSYGSNNTFLEHIEGNSGLVNQLGGASAIASYQYLQTDGYQTNVKMNRDTSYVKYLQPIGKDTTITFLSNYNKIKFYNPLPVTQQQIDTLGRNFGLSSDPTSPLYAGYNYRKNQTDFEYIGIDSAVTNSWHVNGKAYTYFYGNGSYDTASVASKIKETWHYGDNVGRYKLSAYRAWGETLNVTWDNAYGVLKLGGWHEYHRAKRIQYNLDYTKGTVLDFDPKAATGSRSAYNYDLVNYLFTTQLFAEYDWRINKDFTINGGVKDVQFKRTINADINQTTKTPLNYTKDTSKALGSLSANYSILNEWTVYAQASQGFLAPNLSLFYVPDPSVNQTKPQETMNYQVGSVFKKDRLNTDVALYHIDYKNYPHLALDPITNLATDYVLAQGAYFDGAEAEATFFLGHGTSLYANGSINKAKYKKSKLDVEQAAQSTAALGVMYDQSGIFGSVIAKYVGSSKVYYSTLSTGFNPDDASSVAGTGISPGYCITDFAIGYGTKLSALFLKNVKFKFEVNNILDRKVQVMDSFTSAGIIQYNPLPTRNYFISVSAEF